ncbi:hypothetical protein [Tepidimicrobium xylanilyticum]
MREEKRLRTEKQIERYEKTKEEIKEKQKELNIKIENRVELPPYLIDC